MSQELIQVEVAYALPEKQMIIPLTVLVGSTLFEVAVKSKIVEHFADLDLETATMGVFSKIEKNPKSRVIQAGERVEIYRPLINDPKEARKARAAKAKENKLLLNDVAPE
jgi:putative ubiquitin-RnfH superfamily antitoxin RatB of RatAB toxin-antitoxin module